MINLLPPKEKERLVQEENWKLILILGILTLSSLLALSLILFSINIYILGQFESQKIIMELEKKEFLLFEPFQKKMDSINQDLSGLNSFYQNQVDSTQLFEEILEILPQGTYLTSFSYRRNGFQLTLSGFCPKRELLFEFRENLMKQKKFKGIYFPPSNWVEPEDIRFSTNLIWMPQK